MSTYLLDSKIMDLLITIRSVHKLSSVFFYIPRCIPNLRKGLVFKAFKLLWYYVWSHSIAPCNRCYIFLVKIICKYVQHIDPFQNTGYARIARRLFGLDSVWYRCSCGHHLCTTFPFSFLAVSVRPNPNRIRTELSPNFHPDTRWNPHRILPAFPEPSPTQPRHFPASTSIICRSGFFQARSKEPTPTNSESELDLDKRPTIPIPLRHQTASTPNVSATSPNYSVSCRSGFGLRCDWGITKPGK
jgi:hypothetical protein